MELTKTASIINDYFYSSRKNLAEALNFVAKNNSYDDFAMYEWLKLHEVVCIFLNLHPEYINAHKHPKYNTIFNALERHARDNPKAIGIKIKRDNECFHDLFGYETDFEIFLSHDFARAWAKTHGLNWNVPPYKAIQLSNDISTANTENITELQQQLKQAQEEIARLKQQIEALQDQSLQPLTEEPQDDNSKPCHLNKFVNPDPLAIAIEIRNIEWKDYSDDKPIRSSAQIVNSFRRKYPNVTTTLMQKIEHIACPIDRRRNK